MPDDGATRRRPQPFKASGLAACVPAATVACGMRWTGLRRDLPLGKRSGAGGRVDLHVGTIGVVCGRRFAARAFGQSG